MFRTLHHIVLGLSLLFLFLGTQVANTLHVWEEAHQHEQTSTVPTDCDLCDVIQNFQHQSFDVLAPAVFDVSPALALHENTFRLESRYKTRSSAQPTNKAPPVLG